jgi:hypothetical protein
MGKYGHAHKPLNSLALFIIINIANIQGGGLQ